MTYNVFTGTLNPTQSINVENLYGVLIIFTYLETGMNTLRKQAVYLFILLVRYRL